MINHEEIKAGIIVLIIWLGVPCLYLLSIPYPEVGGIWLGALVFSLTAAAVYREYWKTDHKKSKEKISSLNKEIAKLKRQNDLMKNFVEWQHGWRPSDYKSDLLSTNVCKRISEIEDFFYEESKKEWKEAYDRIYKTNDGR